MTATTIRTIGRALVTTALLAGSLRADEPDWEAMPFTSHSDFQAIDDGGFGTFPVNAAVRMRGVILHDSANILDSAAAAPGFLGGMWQTFIQTVDEGDFGGSVLWMGQYLGRINGTHPEGSYSDAEWLAELDRLTHDPLTGHLLRPGDLVEVRARAPGLHFRGKTNINEQHTIDPAADFDVLLLEAEYGLPAPTVVHLSDLKDASDAFIFDSTRATGCEHHQATLVRINNVTFFDTAGWAPGAELLIQDGTGRTFPVKLGLGAGFTDFPVPAGSFDIVGLLDQEDLNADDGYLDGYRLWIAADYDGNELIVPAVTPQGDFDANNDVDLADFTGFGDCLSGPEADPKPIGATAAYCRSAFDFDRDGDIDLTDYARFADTLH